MAAVMVPRSLLSNGVWWWGVGGVVLGFSGGFGMIGC